MKKSSYLQTLYLQKPWLLIILIAIIATLPWIGLGDFYTKGEPREAALAISMIKGGNWIIPYGIADEFAYKPPLNHWIMAGFAYLFNNGEVTPFISRLPSAIGFIGLIGVCFMFFARRRSPLESFVTCLILITCFEIHRAAMTTRLDMLLAFFMVTSFIQLFLWKEKGRKRYLVSSWIFLTLATLVKGPVGVVLPCGIFAIYLLTTGENFFKVVAKSFLIAIPAFIVPFIWYYLAYQIKGNDFLHLVLAENFGRFFSIKDSDLDIKYRLGVENPWWYYPVTLVTGFIPQTLLLIISLFFLKYRKPRQSVKQSIVSFWAKLKQNQVLLYSFLIVIVMLIFFTIPTSKRSVYIIPLYPFLSLFLAQYFIYLVQNKPRAVRIYTYILAVISLVITLIIIGAVFHIIDLDNIGSLISKRERTLHDISLVSGAFKHLTIVGSVALVILVYALCMTFYLLFKQSNLKVLMASFGLVIALNIFIDGCVLPEIKNGNSSRPFAEMILKKYPLNNQTYIVNDLLKYSNPYGLNFYLGNQFKNLEKEQPESGYFITGENYIDDIKKDYPNYTFTELEKTDRYTDFKMPTVLYKIQKID